MTIDQDVANKYLLGELEPLPGFKPVKVIEMDPADIDIEMPERDQ